MLQPWKMHVLILEGSFKNFLKLSMKTIISSMNRLFYFFIFICMLLFFFLYCTGFISLFHLYYFKVFQYNVERISGKGNSCPDPNIMGKAFTLSY